MAVPRVRSDKVPEIEGPALSGCKRVGPHVYISGQVAWDGDQNPLGGNNVYEVTVQATDSTNKRGESTSTSSLPMWTRRL